MSFIDLDALPYKALFTGAKIRVAWGEKIMLSFLEFEPNAVVPPHSHPHEQAGIILEGAFDLTIGDQTRTLKVGNSYIVPSNVVHSVRVPNAPAKALDIFSPPREEYKPVTGD